MNEDGPRAGLVSREATRRGKIGWLAALLALVGLAGLTQGQGAEPTNGPRRIDPAWHALVHATATVRPGEVIADATIVFKDGVIVSVTPGGAPPAGARVWDCTGLNVYAGLIEPYAPVDAPRPDATSPGKHWNDHVMAERSALDGAGLDAEARKKLRAEGYVAAAIAPKGGIFTGSGAVVMLGERPDTSDEPAPVLVRRAFHNVNLDVPQGNGDDRYPNSRMGVVALVRQVLADVPWFARASEAYASEPSKFERPAPSDALAALQDPAPLFFDISHEQDVSRAAKIASEFGRSAVIVGCGTEFRRLRAVVDTKLPIVLPLAFAEKPETKSAAERDAVGLRELMTWEASPTNPRRLDAAGATVALTTSNLPKKQEFFANLREAIRAGLPADRALAMLTTAPAQILGVANVLGTIEPGKKACLVVVKGGLFDKDREIRDVWVDGVRNEVSPTPKIELAGTWNVTLRAPGGDVTGTLNVKPGKTPKIAFERPETDADRARDAKKKAEKDAQAKPEAAKAEAPASPEGGAPQAADAEAKQEPAAEKPRKFDARDVSLEENRVDFALDAQAIGLEEGTLLLSAVVETDIAGAASVTGEGPFAWSATRAGDAEAKKDDEKLDPRRYEGIPDSFGLPFGPYAMDALPPQRDMVITGATIWTGESAGIIENGTLVISGGKIVSVLGAGASANVPAGATRIDAKGKHITAGLIDCHSHTGIMGGVNESGQTATAEVRIADMIDPDAINWYRQLAGGLTSANQLHGSANPIGGQNSVVKLRWGVAHPDEMRFEGAASGIKFALGENVKQSNWGTQYTSRYPQTRMGVETFIVDRFTAAREYAASWDAWNARSEAEKKAGVPPRRDLELEALAEILAGERLVHCHSYRQDEILMLCRVAHEFGFKIGTFQHVLEGYKVADEIARSALGASAFSDWWAYKWEVFDAIPQAGAIMHDAGVVVSFNSDSDELARRMNYEAAKAVKYGGVRREDAFNFVALNPAKQLKIDGRVGSLAAGKDADFVIWSGDPLSTLTRCEATFIDGREYFSLEQDAQHRKKNAQMRTRILRKLIDKAPDEKPESEGKDKPAPAAPPAYGDASSIDDAALAGMDDQRAGRGMGLMPVGTDGVEAARDLAIRRGIERQVNWMILNGIDPGATRCGECGCGVSHLAGGAR